MLGKMLLIYSEASIWFLTKGPKKPHLYYLRDKIDQF